MSRDLAIALLRPPVIQRPASLSGYGAVPPIGLAYVAAALRADGHRVCIIDAAGEALDRSRPVDSPVGRLLETGLTVAEAVARLPERVDVVGISHMFLHEWPTIARLVEAVAAARPGARIVLGGENATSFWRWILPRAQALTCCVLGEGEETIRALCRAWAEGRPWQHLPGLAFAGPEGPTSTGLAPRLRDLSELPRPAWDLVPLARYHALADHHGVHRGRSLPVLATRGCPYRCTFCSAPEMWTTRYVTRDPVDVVDELEWAVERWGIENFNFCDLTAIVRRDWILAFCAELARRDLAISWQLPTGTRSEALDAEVLAALHRTGCRNLTYAPESGSPRMLGLLQKRVKPERMLASLGAAHRAGLVTRVNVIVGHPEEEAADLVASLRLLLACAREGCDDAAVMVFAPYPGSADFQALHEAGRVDLDDPAYCYLALTRAGGARHSWHPRWGPRRLHAVQLGMLLAFYGASYGARPARFWQAAGSLATGRERTQLDQLVRTKLGQLGPARAAAGAATP